MSLPPFENFVEILNVTSESTNTTFEKLYLVIAAGLKEKGILKQ
jgi:hypothetical protein